MLVEGLVLEVDAVRLPSDWGRVGRTAVMGAGADRMSLPGSRSSVKVMASEGCEIQDACGEDEKVCTLGMAAEKLVGSRSDLRVSIPGQRLKPGSGRESVESWPPDPQGPVASDEALACRLCGSEFPHRDGK